MTDIVSFKFSNLYILKFFVKHKGIMECFGQEFDEISQMIFRFFLFLFNSISGFNKFICLHFLLSVSVNMIPVNAGDTYRVTDVTEVLFKFKLIMLIIRLLHICLEPGSN